MPNSFHTTQRNTFVLVSNDITIVKSNKNFFLIQTDNSGFNGLYQNFPDGGCLVVNPLDGSEFLFFLLCTPSDVNRFTCNESKSV